MLEIAEIIKRALQEDIGSGDVTTMATVPAGTIRRAELVAKENFTLAGLDVARQVFTTLDPDVAFEPLKFDGNKVQSGDVLAWIKGDARVLLQGERVALHLL